MDNRSAWWRTFFSGPFVDLWLRVTPPEQTRQEVDFLEEALEARAPARLLDVPCGGGRHSLALAARGHEMTGVDLSAGFLEAARSADASRSVTWEQQEMRLIPWVDRFDGAFCFGNSFAYDDDEGNAEFLRAVARALRPGARFVLDTGYVMEALLPNLQERAWVEIEDMLFLSLRRYDHVESRLHVEYRIIQDGAIDLRSMSARLYGFRELLLLLVEAGLTPLHTYSSLTREPFKLGSGRLIIVAQKD